LTPDLSSESERRFHITLFRYNFILYPKLILRHSLLFSSCDNKQQDREIKHKSKSNHQHYERCKMIIKETLYLRLRWILGVIIYFANFTFFKLPFTSVSVT